MISPTDQCLIFWRSQRESQLISSNIKALSTQSACKPEKRTRSRARMSFDTQESTCVSAIAKTNENRTVMCWNIAVRDQRSDVTGQRTNAQRSTPNIEHPCGRRTAYSVSHFQNFSFSGEFYLVTRHISLVTLASIRGSLLEVGVRNPRCRNGL